MSAHGPAAARVPADRAFGSVVFDCDATLSRIEGIEELAAGNRAEVTALTEAAMRGEVPLEEVYGRRLALVRPTRAAVEALGRRYVETLVPHARETVAALLGAGVRVRIVSGGIRLAVVALARSLGLEDDDVAAVDVRFDSAGAYAGFEEDSPLAVSGGKLEVLRRWAPGLPGPVALVGDGATDLEARPAVDLFVAFAGVVARPQVVAAADAVIRVPSLAPVLPLVLPEPPADPAAADLWRRGLALLESSAS